METNKKSETACCPEFNPTIWDDRIVEWTDKKFIKDNVFTFFYMPFGFGKVMKRLNEILEQEGATTPDWLCLSDHTSKWNMDIYLAVDKEIKQAENISLSGKYFCKVYDGPFRDTGKWIKEFEGIAKAKEMKIQKWFMWYTTCPKCAKKYGKNYVVIVAKIE